MSKKYALDSDDSSAIANDTIVSPDAVSGPVYASSYAASNSYRSYQWYLDGKLTVGGNTYGANVDKISTEYTGAGVKVGIIDQGFDITNIDLVGRFDLTQSFDPRCNPGRVLRKIRTGRLVRDGVGEAARAPGQRRRFEQQLGLQHGVLR
jgi:subtilisin family serine protease